MAMKMMKAPKGTFTTWMAGFGMGVFAMCFPFHEIAATGWPRIALGTIGLAMWCYGLIYALKNQPKPGEAKVEPATSSNI